MINGGPEVQALDNRMKEKLFGLWEGCVGRWTIAIIGLADQSGHKTEVSFQK